MLLQTLRHLFQIGSWRDKHAKRIHLIVWPVSGVGGAIERDGATIGGVIQHDPGHWKGLLAPGGVQGQPVTNPDAIAPAKIFRD